MIYLSGHRDERLDRAVNAAGDELTIGLLIQPGTGKYLRHATGYGWCGIDNGCFSAKGRAAFTVPKYLSLIGRALDRFGDFVLFAAAPDVVGDWPGTLAASLPVLPLLRDAGVTAALVLQDGATAGTVPWGECDALFVGGSTAWKLGPQAAALCREGKRRNKWVHMGRVNSARRLRAAWQAGCDSVDGTFSLYKKNGGEDGFAEIAGWLEDLEQDRRREWELEMRRLSGRWPSEWGDAPAHSPAWAGEETGDFSFPETVAVG